MKFLQHCLPKTEPSPLDFSPPLLRLQDSPPNPVGRAVLTALLVLLVALILWALLGKLDIVAVAEGRLVPQSYLKIVQPSESGIVKEIRVKEGMMHFQAWRETTILKAAMEAMKYKVD